MTNPSPAQQTVPPQSPAPPGAGSDPSAYFIQLQALKYQAWDAYIRRNKDEALALAERLSVCGQALRDAVIEELAPTDWRERT